MRTILDHLSDTDGERLRQLADWLRIPSISSHPDNQSDMLASAVWCADFLRTAGLDAVTLHPTAGHPIVTASWRRRPDAPTLLIYGHYDVQPVDPLGLWETGPFDPVVRDDRIYARGSADDKGQILMHMQAVAATLAVTGSLPVNVVFLIEGEEEIGSPNLPDFLVAHADLLRADLAIVSDTCQWDEGVPAITAGLRGLAALEIALSGPGRDLHSGSFGGAVANPLEALARMLATLKDDQGVIQVEGYLDDVRPPTPAERSRVAEIPFDESAFFGAIGLESGWGEQGFSPLERLWYRPTIEINGLWGGYMGPGAKTVLPACAHAKLSMRLVPDQTPERALALLMAHLRAVTPPGMRLELFPKPGGGLPWRLDPDLPAVQAARRALRDAFGREPVIIGEGATIPVVADFERLLAIKTLLVGFSLPDAAPHAPNENLHLPSFHVGTKSLVGFLHQLSR
ncbi:MAG: dipeptidase [Magnetococcales bacterium]|nr:dipeptidase [Magnetococcales bacterium]